MALGSLVKTLQNIMRNDAGINGDAQRIEQMTWLFFLKIYDAKEEEWEFHDDSYESIIPDRLRWHSWAPDAKDGSSHWRRAARLRQQRPVQNPRRP